MIKLSEKSTVIKNYLAINLSLMILYAAFNSASSIQPIIYQEASFGTIAQIVTYLFNLFTCLVFPQILIDLIGYKYTFLIGVFFTATYIFIQIHLRFYTLMISAVLSGIGGSFVWPTFGIYLTMCNTRYIKLTSMDFSSFQTLFFGLSGAIFMLSYVLGYGLVAVILDTRGSSSISKSTNTSNFDYANSCGINNCPSTLLPSFQAKPSDLSFYILYVILVGLCILAFLIALFFMDDMREIKKGEENKKLYIRARFNDEFYNLIKLYSNLDVWCLFPITFYTGFEMTYIWFEYSRAFATCIMGVNYVGWTNVLFGVLGSSVSFGITYLLKYIGVQLGIIFMLMTAITQSIFIISWTPVYNNATVIFLMAVGFSLTLSIYAGQIRGIYGVYFPKNPAAFSAVSIGQTLGFLFGSLLSTYTCNRFKTYFYLGITLFSLFCYVFLLLKYAIKEAKHKVGDYDDQKNMENKSSFMLSKEVKI